MQNNNICVGDALLSYVLQTCNTYSFVNHNLLLSFTDQLNDEEYLLFDYLCFQNLTIFEAIQKIEFSSSKVYRLIDNIKSKGLAFLAPESNIFFENDRRVECEYIQDQSLSLANVA